MAAPHVGGTATPMPFRRPRRARVDYYLVIGMVGIAVALQTILGMTTVARGIHSEVMELREVVVRSVDDWRVLWKQHSTQPPPAVDFSRVIVVAVFLGERPTAGFEVEITAVKAQGGRAVVDYVERRPARDALTAQVLTFPFHIVAVPRDIDAGAVEFRKVESAASSGL
jgi:hypothetical protein